MKILEVLGFTVVLAAAIIVVVAGTRACFEDFHSEACQSFIEFSND